MPGGKRKKRPLVDEVATPVVPGFIVDEFVAAVKQRADAYRRSPIAPSEESLKVLREFEKMADEFRERARTEPFDIRLADWARCKSLSYKAAYRLACAKKIPGLVRIGRKYFVRNENFSAAALISRVHPT
jgi:hypothetical protein